ncbi:hypothetical protein, partial [Aeromonas hydrophila]|uniref:hypothetical protein n=1 Tax=Aeromonas hydrophila TaxID=644 RepID=UPI002B484489
KCDELILGKKDADSRALTQHSENPCARLNAWPSSDHYHVQAVDKGVSSTGLQFPLLPEWGAGAGRDAWQQTEAG